MFAWLDRFSIRHQLWGLFGLFLLAGTSVLLIDEIEQQRARGTLQTLQDGDRWLSAVRIPVTALRPPVAGTVRTTPSGEA